MMRKRTLVFLVLAILLTPVAVFARHEEKILCPESVRRLALTHVVFAQEQEPDDDPEQPAPRGATPCESSNIGSMARISLYVSVGLWVGFVGLLRSDVRRRKMRERRMRRQARTRVLQPGTERVPSGEHDNRGE